MKATVDRLALAKAMRTVLPAVSRLGQLPVLSGVHLDASDGLRVTCTNLETTASVHLDAEGEGAAVVPAQLLHRLVGASKGDRLVFDVDGGNLVMHDGDATARLRQLPLDDWPRLTTPNGDGFELDDDAAALVRKLLPLVSKDTAKPIITGLHFVGDRVEVTDNHRIARCIVGGDFPDVVVPVMRGMFEGPTAVVIDEQQASFTSRSATWTTRLIQGTYPDVGRVIPVDPPHHLTVNGEALADLLDRSEALGSTSNEFPEPIRIRPEGDKIRVDRVVADVGEVVDLIAADVSFDFAIGFRAGYLADLLDMAGPGDVTFQLTEARKPVMVQSGPLTVLLYPHKVPA